MPYSMYDKRGRGDTGQMSMALWPNPDKNSEEKVLYEHGARPRVGVAMRVGALTASTFGNDTWWQTTLIAEIVKDTETEVIFKTKSGSEYTWRII